MWYPLTVTIDTVSMLYRINMCVNKLWDIWLVHAGIEIAEILLRSFFCHAVHTLSQRWCNFHFPLSSICTYLYKMMRCALGNKKRIFSNLLDISSQINFEIVYFWNLLCFFVWRVAANKEREKGKEIYKDCVTLTFL